MNKKTLLILSIIFIIVLIIASYEWWGKYLALLNSLKNQEIDFSEFTNEISESVSIAKTGQQLKTLIKKENKKWYINDFEASQKEINDFFQILKNIKTQMLVSKNAQNHENFGVGDNGYTLTFKTINKKETSFIIGSYGPLLNSFYLRKKDSSNVYLAQGLLLNKISQDINQWRDKTLVNIPKDIISKIEMKTNDSLLTITKNQEGKWQAQEKNKNATLEEATIDRILNSFNPLEADNFLTKDQELEYKKIKQKEKVLITLFDKQNQKLVQIQLAKKNENWWALVEGKDTYYQIPSFKISDIILKSEEIFKK
jgi:hypothetical protein